MIFQRSWFRLALLVLFSAFGTACSPIRVALHPDLREQGSCYTVRGHRSFTFRSQLAFGPYQTLRVRRGAVRSYRWNAIIQGQGASQRNQCILQHLPSGRMDSLTTLDKFKQRDLPVLGGRLQIPLTYTHLYRGEIRGQDHAPAEFVVYQPDWIARRETLCGNLDIPGQPLIQIHAIRQLEGSKAWLGMEPLGYRFEQEGQVLGQVGIVNRGEVCLAQDLPLHLENCLASLSTALLLRQNVTAP